MLKICPVCRRTWSGGRDCPRCGEGHPLIDVAQPQGRKRDNLRTGTVEQAVRRVLGTDPAKVAAAQEVLFALSEELDAGLR